ncbi:ribonuclease P protein component [Candidatus Microgenomates bacterium]|nr:MAG: ribonuclease P protein component [Candidatus Microgenomates bacterium]
MLPRPNRLPATEIPGVLRFGKKQQREYVIAAIRPNHKNVSRFAILISKKAVSKAVHRNRLRRIFKAAIMQMLPGFEGQDVVIRIKARLANETSAEALLILKELLLKK